MNLEAIARPYAKAIFTLAKEQEAIPLWLECIEILSHVVSDQGFKSFINSPSTQKNEISAFILKIFPNDPPKTFQAFITLLVENHRLSVVPAVFSQLVKYACAQNNIRQAQVRTAHKLSDTKAQGLAKALEQRFACQVELDVIEDVDILGGATIKMDDNTVFDGSLSTRLDILDYQLSN